MPLALYLEFEPRPRKWPITISWTIRRGVPKLAHHTCWVLGWLLFVFAASRARDVLALLELCSCSRSRSTAACGTPGQHRDGCPDRPMGARVV